MRGSSPTNEGMIEGDNQPISAGLDPGSRVVLDETVDMAEMLLNLEADLALKEREAPGQSLYDYLEDLKQELGISNNTRP